MYYSGSGNIFNALIDLSSRSPSGYSLEALWFEFRELNIQNSNIYKGIFKTFYLFHVTCRKCRTIWFIVQWVEINFVREFNFPDSFLAWFICEHTDKNFDLRIRNASPIMLYMKTNFHSLNYWYFRINWSLYFTIQIMMLLGWQPNNFHQWHTSTNDTSSHNNTFKRYG